MKASLCFAVICVGCGVGDASDPRGPDVQSETTSCRKQVFLHVADYSWVPPLDSISGVHKNACWGYERRSDGFTCEYAASEADHVATDDGGAGFASYDEITPPHIYDAAAVASCAHESSRPVKTYAGNAPHWNQQGIAASVKFAELYLHEQEADPYFGTWQTSYRGSFQPMINLGPSTGVDAYDTYSKTMRICNAVGDGDWIGIYFYDPDGTGGAGMADWKALEIIYALNACTAG